MFFPVGRDAGKGVCKRTGHQQWARGNEEGDRWESAKGHQHGMFAAADSPKVFQSPWDARKKTKNNYWKLEYHRR